MKPILFFIFLLSTTLLFAQKNYRIIDEFRVPFCINDVENTEIDEKGRLMVAGLFHSGICLTEIDPILWSEQSKLARLDYQTGDYDLTYSSFIGEDRIVYKFKYLYGNLRYFNFAGWPLSLKDNGNIDSTVWYKGPIQLTGSHSGGIADIAEDSNGGFIMTGEIGHYNDPTGETRRVCYRLKEDLSVDTSFFNPVAGFVQGIQHGSGSKVVPHYNDTYLITGTFDWYGDYFSPCIVRVFGNGLIDTTFKSPFASLSAKIINLLVLPDGKIWVTGNLYENEDDDIVHDFLGIVRLLPNGEIDASVDYQRQIGTSNGADALFQMKNGNLIWGGNFSHFHGLSRGSIAMTDSNGILISDAFTGVGFKGPRIFDPEGPGEVNSILQLGGDTLLVGGAFQSFDGNPAHHLVKLVPISTSSTQQMTANNLIKIFPNPTSDILKIELLDFTIQGHLEIFHMDGKLVYSSRIGSTLYMDVSNWPQAIYIVKITTPEYTSSKKISIY
jgi:hypothetical protein